VNNRSVAALDIGSTKVCAIVAEVQDFAPHNVMIKGSGLCPCEGIRSGSVSDPAATIQAIEQAVDEAGKQANCEVDSVYLGISGKHIGSLTSTGRATITNAKRTVSKRDVDDVIEASRKIVLPPDRQIIHAIPLSFAVDGVADIVQPIGMKAERLEVVTHIVHGASAILANVEKCVTQAGLDIDECMLAVIAAGESVLLPEEKESGVCLLDIGGTSSNLGVFVSGVIFHSALIPIGGIHVTKDIAFGLTVTYSEAERLKIQNGSAMVEQVRQDEIVAVRQVGTDTSRKLRRRALVQIIEPRMQELFQLVLEELRLGDCLDKIPSGIVITGGGSLLNGSMELVNQALGMPIRLGGACCAGGLTGTLKQPLYATAIGLAQMGGSRCQSKVQQSEIPKKDNTRTIWNQLVRSIKRAVPPQ